MDTQSLDGGEILALIGGYRGLSCVVSPQQYFSYKCTTLHTADTAVREDHNRFSDMEVLA